MKLPLLEKLAERVALNEARESDAICKDPARLKELTQACVNELKKTTDDVGSLPMALVAQRVRSFADAELIDQNIRLNRVGLEAVVMCILDEIRTRGNEYGLFDDTPPAA